MSRIIIFLDTFSAIVQVVQGLKLAKSASAIRRATEAENQYAHRMKLYHATMSICYITRDIFLSSKVFYTPLFFDDVQTQHPSDNLTFTELIKVVILTQN